MSGTELGHAETVAEDPAEQTLRRRSPLFSVIVPVYNKEKYVARALESVLSQTFQDFEIVAVLDPSRDQSDREVARFADRRIRIFRRDRPGPGGYAARNLGLRMARGTWVAFLDADDEWLPWHLEKLSALAQGYPEARFLSSGWVNVRDGAETMDSYSATWGRQKGNHVISLECFLRESYRGRRPVHTSVACVKRVRDGSMDGLFPSGTGATRGGDLHAWLTLMCRHKALAWSYHAGVRYSVDVDGQVTKVAPHSLALFGRNVMDPLREGLTNTEIRWFNRYINMRLYAVLLGAKRAGIKLSELKSAINWPYDRLTGVWIYVVNWIPGRWIRALTGLRRCLR